MFKTNNCDAKTVQWKPQHKNLSNFKALDLVEKLVNIYNKDK